jgi:hypothetical protein
MNEHPQTVWSDGNYDPLGDVLRAKEESIRRANEWQRTMAERTQWHSAEVFRKWLLSRPPHVRAVAEKFPPGTQAVIDGQAVWLVSYVETQSGGVMLRFSATNPAEDYDGAITSEPIYVCSEHFMPPAPAR